MPAIFGRSVIDVVTNKSGGALAKGDVVIVDTTNDHAVTTTTSGATTATVGVVVEENGIASNATGRVQFAGYCALATPSASVTRGHYAQTHTVAKQCTGNATRQAGSFGQFLTGGTTPTVYLFGIVDGSTGAGGIAATIFDAKGDIIAATAADTASRLAVGANGSALVADSGEATGLKWGLVGAFAEVIYTTGDITLGSGTSPVVLPGPGDCVVAAATGDHCLVGLSARTTDTDADSLSMDAATIVSAAPVNYISSRTGTPHTTGVPGWYFGISRVEAAGAVYPYVVAAGDISSGSVTFRLYYRVSGTGKVLAASSTIPLTFWVWNMKQ